jgi:hypothetical protein
VCAVCMRANDELEGTGSEMGGVEAAVEVGKGTGKATLEQGICKEGRDALSRCGNAN